MNRQDRVDRKINMAIAKVKDLQLMLKDSEGRSECKSILNQLNALRLQAEKSIIPHRSCLTTITPQR